MKFFFLLTFAAAIPAIISGGIAERAKFSPQAFATFAPVGLVSVFEGTPRTTILACKTGLPPNLARPSMTLPARWWCTPLAAGWTLAAVAARPAPWPLSLKWQHVGPPKPSSIPFWPGAWILIVGWRILMMSAQNWTACPA